MISRINSSDLSRAQKIQAVEGIKSAISFVYDDEQNRKVEKVLDEFTDIHAEDEIDDSSKEVIEDDDTALYRTLFTPVSDMDFFNLLYTPGDENLLDIRMKHQDYTHQPSSQASISTNGLKNKVDETMRETYYEMSKYFFVSVEGIHLNQYI